MAEEAPSTLPEATPTTNTTDATSSAPPPSEEKAPQPPLETKAADTPSISSTWPSLSDTHPLSKLRTKLPSLLEKASHTEVYGIDLQSSSPFHQNLILQKFLRANANDVDKATVQLKQTLEWRKSFQPLQTLNETFSAARFGGLGYVIRLKDVPESTSNTKEKGDVGGNEHEKKQAEDVATFNIYGAVSDPKLTFGDIDGFLRWRVALMELSLRELHLADATVPIPDFGQGPDPYQALQIHDYLQVSFLRQNSYTKAASKKAIEVFREYYPETLSRKFFVNVPVVMGWMFSAMSLVLPKETTRKFTVLSYGEYLKGSLGEDVPPAYGGKGPSWRRERLRRSWRRGSRGTGKTVMETGYIRGWVESEVLGHLPLLTGPLRCEFWWQQTDGDHSVSSPLSPLLLIKDRGICIACAFTWIMDMTMAAQPQRGGIISMKSAALISIDGLAYLARY